MATEEWSEWPPQVVREASLLAVMDGMDTSGEGHRDNLQIRQACYSHWELVRHAVAFRGERVMKWNC